MASVIPTQPTLKKRKLDDKKPERLQCEFFILKKNRHCAMTRRADSKFCAEHSTDELKDRVPCPKDPSHSVWLKNLSKHIKKCNATKDAIIVDPCFEENLNWETGEDILKISSLQEDRENFMNFITHLELEYDKHIKEELVLEDQYDKEDALNSRFEELTNQKHIIQQASIITHLKKIDILSSNKYLIIEFGCGKLELSRYVNKFMNSRGKFPDYLLIDRALPRLKYDGKFIKDFKEGEDETKFTSEIKRHKIDIKDLSLDKAIGEMQAKPFAISKHLCGVATDLTLRCCLNSTKFQDMKGVIVIAMCCRHCCSYDQLLSDSKSYLKENFAIDKFKFNNYLIKLSSWATCGKREGQDDDGHFTGLNYEQRLAIGLKLRRIIDESRKYAMLQRGYNVKICKYVKREISLENHLMIIQPA